MPSCATGRPSSCGLGRCTTTARTPRYGLIVSLASVRWASMLSRCVAPPIFLFPPLSPHARRPSPSLRHCLLTTHAFSFGLRAAPPTARRSYHNSGATATRPRATWHVQQPFCGADCTTGCAHRRDLPPPRSRSTPTIQSYVPWNIHSQAPGVYDFTSPSQDIVAFARAVGDAGMVLLLRAGPYICGEHDFGGLPSYLLATPGIASGADLRTNSTAYLAAVTEWWSALLPVIAPHTYASGGSIVQIQLENEYGA